MSRNPGARSAPTWPSRRRHVVVALLLAVVTAWWGAPPADAASDAASRPVAAPGAWPTVPEGTYRAPVDAAVIDPFRAPETPWGPGNRGLEYATVPGTPVRVIGSGRVVFAGQVGGRLAVTVLHADGRRSSYSDLGSVQVQLGELVPRGAVLGGAGPTLHLGLREGDRYVDPAAFLGGARRAVLVPVARSGAFRSHGVVPLELHAGPGSDRRRQDHDGETSTIARRHPRSPVQQHGRRRRVSTNRG